MRLKLFLIGFTIILFNALAFGAVITNTYNAGDIPTNDGAYSGACNGAATPLTVTLPVGGPWIVSSIDVVYNMTSLGGGWMSEQRSRLSCQNTGNDEGADFTGTGNNGGTQGYTRGSLNIANGTYAGGTNLIFELQAFRTWAGTAGCNSSVAIINDGTWEVTVNYSLATPMTFSSFGVFQAATSDVFVSTVDNVLLGVEIITTGTTAPISLTDLEFNLGGSSNISDFTNTLKVYYTGSSNVFATGNLFDSQALPATVNGWKLFTGNQVLQNGSNYFWIAIDVAPGATVSNVVDAVCRRATVDGADVIGGVVQNPGGNRVIKAAPPTPGGTTQNVGVWLKSNDGTLPSAGTGPLATWDNHGVGGTITVHGTDFGVAKPGFNVNGYNFNPKIHFNGDYNFLSLPDNAGVTFGAVYVVANLEDLTRVNTHICSWWNVSNSPHADGSFHGGSFGPSATEGLIGYNNEFPLGVATDCWRSNGVAIDGGVTPYSMDHGIISSVAKAGDLDSYADRFLGGQHIGVDIPERDWLGDVSEVIVLEGTGTPVEREKIESYLAIKYGLTLGVNGTSKDYISGIATNIWNQAAQAGFNYDITGIGRDDASALVQRKSHTEMWTAGQRNDILTVANGTSFVSPSAFADDNSFFVWGHNNAPTINTGSIVNYNTDNGQVIQTILQREWKSQETGTVNKVTLKFDLSSVMGVLNTPGDNDLSFLRLLVDEDGDFSNGATAYAPVAFNSVTGIAYFQHNFTPTDGNNMTQDNGFFFTLASTNYILTPLPVNLFSFDINCDDKISNRIEWVTKSEINNDYYILEKSMDAQNWEFLSKIDGAGTTSALSEYEYIDNERSNELVYYRLQQVDFDGKVTLLSVDNVNCVKNKPLIYPNPFNDELYVEFKSENGYLIEIRDVLGRIVYQKIIDESTGETQVLNLGGLETKGVYYIFISIDSENLILPQKIIKY